jgi:hypothetical protein
MKAMKITYYLYVVTDKFGNKGAGVVNNSHNILSLNGVFTADKEELHFENHAFHAESFARHYGLHLDIIRMFADI